MPNAEDPPVLSPRRARWAVLLSLFGSGIGHVYAGRAGKGLLLLVLELLPACLLFIVALLTPNDAILYVLLGIIAFRLLLFVYALGSAVLTARRAPEPFLGGPFQRGVIYAFLAFVSVGWSVGGALLVRAHAFEAFYIPTASMEPTIREGDRILVNKTRLEDLRRGDIVVFRCPQCEGRQFIKRVRGLPGDRVDGTDVPAGQIWVLGDNLENSLDSRRFGPVPIDSVVGVAQYVFWSRGGPGALRTLR